MVYFQPENTLHLDKRKGKPDYNLNLISIATGVLQLETQSILLMANNLPNAFVAAIELLKSTQRRVIVSGMGKSGRIGRKIVATLSSTGTPALFLHPGEAASHGDLGMVTTNDACILLSNSGETR